MTFAVLLSLDRTMAENFFPSLAVWIVRGVCCIGLAKSTPTGCEQWDDSSLFAATTAQQVRRMPARGTGPQRLGRLTVAASLNFSHSYTTPGHTIHHNTDNAAGVW